ncbi:CoA-binding protein [Candidatus Woesearchaeota archaeon]|nr:CoA-binding protein [Candidatus Woesearchaeota archaeon]
MNLDTFFRADRIAVIGASREEGKVGNVVFKNFLEGFDKEVFPVNPNADEVLGYKCYKSVRDIPGKPELAIICIPAKFVPGAVIECGKKGIRHVIIISAGFKEVGNDRLEKDLFNALKKYDIKCIGPNCLGVYASRGHIDTLFLPKNRLKRPKAGVISFVSQSGASGSAILDLAAEEGFGFAKFISYGNAINVDESDLIEYLGNDADTKVICLYVEGVKDGRKFLETCKKVAAKKPVIAIKGGITDAGKKAALSHTGSLAGSAEVYFGAFKQAGVTIAHTLEEVFDYMKVFEKVQVRPKGRKIQVITNGGGFGILCSDAVAGLGLEMSEMSSAVKNSLKKKLPSIAAVGNPVDLLGDATTERYRLALDACIKDKNVDVIVAVVLSQTPLIEKEIITDVLEEFNNRKKKPIVTVTTGSEFSEKLKQEIEDSGLPCFRFPFNAVRAVKAYLEYYKKI